jgi:hypothetical protein
MNNSTLWFCMNHGYDPTMTMVWRYRAVSIGHTGGVGTVDFLQLLPIGLEAQGSSVPIGRGNPPPDTIR